MTIANNQNSVADKTIDAGSVSTHAIIRFRTVLY
jgi:hypothetical protein